jgi:hypothetical protein
MNPKPVQEIENFDSDPFEKPLPAAEQQLYCAMKSVMPDLLTGAAAAVRARQIEHVTRVERPNTYPPFALASEVTKQFCITASFYVPVSYSLFEGGTIV